MQVALPLISPPPKVSGQGMRGSVGTRREAAAKPGGEFGSVAVLGLESMRDLRSLRDAYGFERVRGDPGAARRGGERRFVATALLLGEGSGRSRIRYVSPVGRHAEPWARRAIRCCGR
jgi:hypothetical protein